jgi:uncharacterized protein
MMNRVVSNTGPFISLERIPNGFRLLRLLYDRVLIPDEVLGELAFGLGTPREYLEKYDLHDIVAVMGVGADDPSLAQLDLGEKHAIALALRENLPVLLEDRVARRIAEEKGLRVSGVAGIIKCAFEQNLISSSEAVESLSLLMMSNRLPKKVFLAVVGWIGAYEEPQGKG